MYKLNELSIKTTNSFNINELKIEMEIPTNLVFKNYIIENEEKISIDYSINKNFNSLIGLKMDKYLNINIDLKESNDNPLILNYDFIKNDNLVDCININYLDNVKRDIIIKYESKDNYENFNYSKLNIIMNNNAIGNISVINLLNDNSTNLLASLIDLKDNSHLDLNVIDIGSRIKINNIKSITGKNATSNLNNIYIGQNNDTIDMNYEYINKNSNSNNSLEVQGILNDMAKKKFKGTINFIKGSSGSIGKELENVILLSDNVINSSVPLLLCEEEDVEGSHAVSSGKIDDKLLFYLNTKGINKIDATKLICMANLNRIIKKVNNNNLEEYIKNVLDKKILK